VRYLRPAVRSTAVAAALVLGMLATDGAQAQTRATEATPALSTYFLGNLASGNCLAINTPTSPGVIQAPCASTRLQGWQLYHQNGAPANVFSLMNAASGLCVNSTVSPVTESTCQPSPAQGWTVIASGANYQLQSYTNGNNLAVPSPEPGAPAVLQAPTSSPNEVWAFKPAPS